MFKKGVKKWRIDKKHKEHEMRAVIIISVWRSVCSKKTSLKIRGQPIDYESALNYWKRRGVSIEQVIDLNYWGERGVSLEQITEDMRLWPAKPADLLINTPPGSPVTQPTMLTDAESILRLVSDHAYTINTSTSEVYSDRLIEFRQKFAFVMQLFGGGEFERGGKVLRSIPPLFQTLLSEQPKAFFHEILLMKIEADKHGFSEVGKADKWKFSAVSASLLRQLHAETKIMLDRKLLDHERPIVKLIDSLAKIKQDPEYHTESIKRNVNLMDNIFDSSDSDSWQLEMAQLDVLSAISADSIECERRLRLAIDGFQNPPVMPCAGRVWVRNQLCQILLEKKAFHESKQEALANFNSSSLTANDLDGKGVNFLLITALTYLAKAERALGNADDARQLEQKAYKLAEEAKLYAGDMKYKMMDQFQNLLIRYKSKT